MHQSIPPRARSTPSHYRRSLRAWLVIRLILLGLAASPKPAHLPESYHYPAHACRPVSAPLSWDGSYGALQDAPRDLAPGFAASRMHLEPLTPAVPHYRRDRDQYPILGAAQGFAPIPLSTLSYGAVYLLVILLSFRYLSVTLMSATRQGPGA